MLERHQPELPDLSRHVALLPSAHALRRFRRLLLDAARDRGHDALLAPWCGTLPAWLQRHATGKFALIGDTERELLLLGALQAYPQLRERFGTWPLVDALLTLFDELNAHRRLPVASADELAALLASGYGSGAADLAPLRSEAELVYTLWAAWNQHLLDRGLVDPGLQRLAALTSARDQAASHHIYMIGTVELTAAEVDWVKALLAQNRLTLLLHGGTTGTGYHPDSPLAECLQRLDLPTPTAEAAPDNYSRLLDGVYAADPDLATRARTFAAAIPESPARDRLGVFEATDFEQEARAVELAIRRCYAAGTTDIGLVTHDRKLARRVRALLERANLTLNDSAGWALSTTSAATALMRWLECVEQDFAHAPLLELLKSPFVTLGLDFAERERLTACFERDVVRPYSLAAGLHRYRSTTRAIGATLEQRAAGTTTALLQLLDRLADAATPLQQHAHATHTPLQHLEALRESLDRLGMIQTLSDDAAGAELLTALRTDRKILTEHGSRLSWVEFQRWLLRELERRRFRPPSLDQGVELLSLSESRGLRFQALIIAGCNRDQFPGALPTSPFFNDGTRRQIGLPSKLNRLTAALHDFRRLLEAAPQVLLTRHREARGEAFMPSPWFERLISFHRLAYGSDLRDDALAALVAAPQAELFMRAAPLPPAVRTPAPQLPPSRIPEVYTASSHQRLIDCPYQFFAADGLGLQPIDDVREELEKLDYGRRVHRILQAFHSGVTGLPGPWDGGPIDSANMTQAKALLDEIARVVMAYDSDARLSARGWRYLWETFTVDYLAWQQARDRLWRVEASEVRLERTLTVGSKEITLRGRADRIDRGSQGVAILDYKTGTAPDAQTVVGGEHAQLPFYALLHSDTVSEVGFVTLSGDGVTIRGIEGDTIKQLADRCEARLRDLIEALHRGAALPAWGDSQICSYCRFEGLCRKEMWFEEAK